MRELNDHTCKESNINTILHSTSNEPGRNELNFGLCLHMVTSKMPFLRIVLLLPVN